MAEVRSCIGRRAQGFAHRINNCCLHVSRDNHKNSVVNGSSLTAGLLLGNTPNPGPQGASTRVKPQLRTVSEDRNAAQDYHYCEFVAYSLSSERQAQRLTTSLPRNQRYTECWRTLSDTFRRHGQWAFVRAYSGNGAKHEPLYKTKTGYYEILGVSSSATQAQIKTAYYKQSFAYHPDRNAGSDEATVRFSEISEAYSVLGNKGLRKKYDRGLLSLSDLTATVRPSAKDTTGSSARPQPESRRTVMGAGGQGGVFDFDKFFKSHYSEQLQRQRDIRTRKEETLKKEQEDLSDKKMGRMMDVFTGMLLLVAVAIVMNL